MCFKKDPTPQDPISEAAKPYLTGKKPFLNLDFTNYRDREIALYCLKRNTALLQQLDKEQASHVSLLSSWIDKDFSNYIHIYNFKLSTPALLERYLYLKFRATKSYDTDLSLMHSLKGKMMLCYRYTTKKGETISYFDNSLGVPTPLLVTADLRLKMINPDAFITALDYHITILDLPLAFDKIHAVINKSIRDSLLRFIMDNHLTYYQLPQFYSELNAAVADNLNVALKTYGLEVVDLNILDISISNNTQELFEKQYFAISEARRVKEYEYAMEETALNLYEKKAEIHNKFPEFPVTLTEAEKDFALNRYLNRNGIDTSLSAEIRKKHLESPDEVRHEGTLTKGKTTKPPILQPSNFKKVYFIALVIMLLVSISICFGSVAGGLIAIGITALIFGIIAVAKYPAFLKTENQDDNSAYLRQLEDYGREAEDGDDVGGDAE